MHKFETAETLEIHPAERWELDDEAFREAVRNGTYVPPWERTDRIAFKNSGVNDDQLSVSPCNNDVDLFISPSGREDGKEKSLRIQKAKTICSRCSIVEKCLETAFDSNETDGVWGGVDMTNPEEVGRARKKLLISKLAQQA